jgi:nucleoid DNA-binding protein
MKKPQIAKRLAKRSGVSKAEAADQLDRVVNDIVSQLRSGQAAALPGLGTFVPGRTWDFQFDKSKGHTK